MPSIWSLYTTVSISAARPSPTSFARCASTGPSEMMASLKSRPSLMSVSSAPGNSWIEFGAGTYWLTQEAKARMLMALSL
jgi:hypothetical protein